jgi:hypothetical protein
LQQHAVSIRHRKAERNHGNHTYSLQDHNISPNPSRCTKSKLTACASLSKQKTAIFVLTTGLNLIKSPSNTLFSIATVLRGLWKAWRSRFPPAHLHGCRWVRPAQYCML